MKNLVGLRLYLRVGRINTDMKYGSVNANAETIPKSGIQISYQAEQKAVDALNKKTERVYISFTAIAKDLNFIRFGTA